MDPRKPPEYILEVFADPTSVKDIVKGESNLSETGQVLPKAPLKCGTRTARGCGPSRKRQG
jgi:hypothetical protein